MFDAVNAMLIEVLKARLDTMGEKESGLYYFYKARLDRKELFPPQERKLIDVVIERFDQSWTVHDIGAGIGTMALGFAIKGHDSYAIERDRRRAAAMAAMKKALCGDFPAISMRFHILNVAFPSHVVAEAVVPNRTLGIVSNLVGTSSQQEQGNFLATLVRYPAAIVDVQRFGIARPQEREWKEVVRRLEQLSGEAWELVSDSGAQGKYFMSSRD
jgi:hypothetical protein